MNPPAIENPRDDKSLGPDPHARPWTEVVAAYGRGAASLLPQILLNPMLPQRTLKSLALRRFREIVGHAMVHNPFYRDLYREAGVRPDAIRTETDLQQIPFLTKALLKGNAEKIQPPESARTNLLMRSSSGSSGAPVKLFFDPIKELPRRLQELRLLVANGFKPWHRQLIFDHPGHLAPTKFLPQRLGLWDRDVFPWWLGIDEAVALINEQRPEVLHGVLSSLRMVALAVKPRGGLSYSPALLVSKGELLDPATRSLIETSLRGRLVDYYATEETGIIAWQCPSGSGYHVDTDLVYVETVTEEGRPTQKGELGEICLTNLYMKTMPFIRYRVGDMGVLSDEPCPCGRGLPLLKNLHGRKIDLIVTPDGEVHHPFGLMVVMEEVPAVARYRMAQTTEDTLLVEVNWKQGSAPEDVREAQAKVVKDLQERLGARMKIEVREVETFAHGFGQKWPLVRGLPGRSFTDLMAGSYKVRF